MSFTDQKRRTATAQEVNNWGGDGHRFRCYICGHKFEVDEGWRWVYSGEISLSNFLVCDSCDKDDILKEWQKLNGEYEEFVKKFWWIHG